MVFDERALLRALRQFRHVRGPDHYRPARRGRGSVADATGLVKRQPLSKEERAVAERDLASLGSGDCIEDKTTVAVEEIQRLNLIEPEEFFSVFDSWVDAKYPGDRLSATKLKVAFRKEHRGVVSRLCLDDIEDIAQAMQ